MCSSPCVWSTGKDDPALFGYRDSFARHQLRQVGRAFSSPRGLPSWLRKGWFAPRGCTRSRQGQRRNWRDLRYPDRLQALRREFSLCLVAVPYRRSAVLISTSCSCYPRALYPSHSSLTSRPSPRWLRRFRRRTTGSIWFVLLLSLELL
jgi:hypothetical protein